MEGRRVVGRLGEALHVGRLWRRHRLDRLAQYDLAHHDDLRFRGADVRAKFAAADAQRVAALIDALT